jgi:MFS family permease
VFLEVPSGALADVIGRRRLLVFAGSIMVVEIALLCFAPTGNSRLLFAIFLLNRMLSGAAEAAASGADEALAYDSLKNEGDVKDWGKVLERQMRLRSMAYMGAMSIGAAVYDPVLMQRITDGLGLNIRLTQALTLRFPLFLTLIMAVITLVTTLRLKEMDTKNRAIGGYGASVLDAFRITLQAGSWILKTPIVLVIIAAALLFDHVIRMVLTLNSQYFRLIDLPEASFGLIGSGLAVLGIFIPRISLALTKRRPPLFNLLTLSFLSFLGLMGIRLFIPKVGLFPVVLIHSAISMNTFFISHYLNQVTSSSQRATVLSFKGLAMNLAYGLIGIFYCFLVATLRADIALAQPELSLIAMEKIVFVKAFGWFPWYFLITWVTFFAFSAWILRNTKPYKL